MISNKFFNSFPKFGIFIGFLNLLLKVLPFFSISETFLFHNKLLFPMLKSLQFCKFRRLFS